MTATPGPEDLAAIAAIEQLKYRYFRFLDLKRFDDLGALLTEGCTASYEDGETELEGRAAIVKFLTDSLAYPGIVTEHHGHHPEITVLSPTTAEGIWYLQDRVVMPEHDIEIGGTAFYEDRYVLQDDQWLISHTGYQRVFEEHRSHSTYEVRSFNSRF